MCSAWADDRKLGRSIDSHESRTPEKHKKYNCLQLNLVKLFLGQTASELPIHDRENALVYVSILFSLRGLYRRPLCRRFSSPYYIAGDVGSLVLPSLPLTNSTKQAQLQSRAAAEQQTGEHKAPSTKHDCQQIHMFHTSDQTH